MWYRIKSFLDLYKLSQPEWIKRTELPAWMYYRFKNALKGYMTVEKISSNSGYLRPGEMERGLCVCFAEGFACYLDSPDSWYTTSVVQHIDWNKMEFTTKNSTYKFTIDLKSNDDLLKEYGPSKSKETE